MTTIEVEKHSLVSIHTATLSGLMQLMILLKSALVGLDHHNPKCSVNPMKRLVCSVRGQGQSQPKFRLLVICSDIFWTIEPFENYNLIWWCIIIHQSVMWKTLNLHGQGHNEDSYNQNLHPWNGHNHIEKHLLITLLLWGVWHTQNETKQNRYATAFCNFKIPAGILSSLTRFPHLHGTSEGQVPHLHGTSEGHVPHLHGTPEGQAQRAPWQTPTAESHTSALGG